ncbi:DUF2971 domain-containing protein [Pontibacillus salipaludis]|uniref:Uncharacterized protein n=1 Tax=Pontibacillus salipaludis TaxID=1697394 RepID=A0ABQ1PYV8_9BACI|nr:DUF2971 domain-containing protein [Pontibacillus salipaludis]GGD07887.1 hypothetical protein GCM10011389_14280 [Pontibacillus salipaludis]
MGVSFNDWKDRYTSRSDLSRFLVHLTKPNPEIGDEVDVLLKILNDGHLKGSGKEGFINGKNKAVCFQDVPLYSANQNILFEKELRRRKETGIKRYTATGIAIKREVVYNSGGRPVIYDDREEAMKYLPEEEYWRIVDLKLKSEDQIVDWMHEREWRVKGDFYFKEKMAHVYILLGGKVRYRKFIKEADEEIIRKIGGITTMAPIIQ